jgi:hypothetical protein
MWVDFPDREAMAHYRVVIEENAPVYARPSKSASVVARLTSNVLRSDPVLGDDREEWAEVTLPDGGKGYMVKSAVRSPAELRAYFKKVKGQWMLSGFYGGID